MERKVSTQRKKVSNSHISWRRCKNIGNSGTNLLFLRIRTKFIPTALGFMLKYRTCNTHSHLHFSWVTTNDCFCTTNPLVGGTLVVSANHQKLCISNLQLLNSRFEYEVLLINLHYMSSLVTFVLLAFYVWSQPPQRRLLLQNLLNPLWAEQIPTRMHTREKFQDIASNWN